MAIVVVLVVVVVDLAGGVDGAFVPVDSEFA